MKSNAILQSNLLDIIFENRNKDYGAYLLRKNYNRRLGSALSIMLGLVLILSILLFLSSKTKVPLLERQIINIVEPLTLSVFKNNVKNLQQKNASVKSPVKSHLTANAKPVIVADNKINKLIATDKIELPSNTLAAVAGVSFPSTMPGENGASINLNKLPAPVIMEKNKLAVEESAEVMPQYPGGVKALLAFLKNNIHSPADIDGDEVITVKIKFVINYNGRTESFRVMDSGGEIFDNEVIRVLKKMPQWIPGKSKGENVSVYYYLPVKFTAGL